MNCITHCFTIFTALICLAILQGCHTTPSDKKVAVAFYNCENFFDTVDNPNTNDDEFTPAGEYRYTQKVYEMKLHNIATVIQSMGAKDKEAPPVLIGLAEVENKTVLNDLARQPELKKRDYKYIIYEGHDKRGINVGLLYSPKYFKIITSEPIAITPSPGEIIPTRDILHVWGVLGKDSVHVFVNHWPSRRNDEMAAMSHGVNKRLIAAMVLKEQINNTLKSNPNSKIIVMGDFNDNPTDSNINNLVSNTGLSNPFTALYQKGEGTEHYQQEWNLFDQVMLSNAFTNPPSSGNGFRYTDAAIYKPDFITVNHGGNTPVPRRGYTGVRWNNGYSDHFPVIVYLGRD